jgi:hypothetical protein
LASPRRCSACLLRPRNGPDRSLSLVRCGGGGFLAVARRT